MGRGVRSAGAAQRVRHRGDGEPRVGPGVRRVAASPRVADGSSAGYGPEGGTGPSDLAYLRIQGQECLYNVWSRLGRAHLEHLLESLRFVAVPQG